MRDKTKALGTDPVGRLVVRLSTPAIAGLLVHALYNVTDAIFVGHGAGTLAIAGIGVAFPFFLIIIGLGQLIGVGSGSILSRALGRADMPVAERALGNAVSLAIFVSVLFAGFALSYRVPLLEFAGATPDVLPHALAYAVIILGGGSFTFILSMTLAATVRAQGHVFQATLPMLVSGGLNIALDPLFIFGLHMGAAGAAWATVISSGLSASYLAFYILSGRGTVHLRVRSLALKVHIVMETLSIGASSFVRVVAASAATVVTNRALGVHGGDLAIAIYSVVNRLLSFTRMPVFGVADGVQPVFGYNYGARQYGRVLSAIGYALLFASALAGMFWVLLHLFPEGFLAMFSSDSELISRGVTALRIMALVIPLFTVQVLVAGLYQAVGHASKALVVSLLRPVLIVLCVRVLSSFFATTGVWAAFPVSDLLSALVVLPMLLHEIRRLRRADVADAAMVLDQVG
jgi:putative MATE family efflux protein